MDVDCTHQPIPKSLPAPPVPPAPPGALQEVTGDSESDAAPLSSAPTVGGDRRRPSVASGYAEDDAESSCSGAGGGGDNCVPAGSIDDDEGGRGAYDNVAVEGDESEDEVDSRMCVPWWRRTVQDAAAGASAGAGGGCARPQAAAPAAVVTGPGHHTAESNRLFWEACIAHGY